MKYFKRGLLIAAILGMVSCKTSTENIQVEKEVVLNDFPSGSSLEYFNTRLYLSGDDAKRLLILDTDYNRIDSVELFKSEHYRVPKTSKADLEASAIIQYNAEPHLLLIGSASLPTREKIILVPVNDPANSQVHSTSVFFKRSLSTSMGEVNIEGAATINSLLILSNRGNLNNQKNCLIFTDATFWQNQETALLRTALIRLPKTELFAGISGLSYIREYDVLLFAASTELTENSFEDGEIGSSYIGWIKDISSKTGAAEISADGFINLSSVNPTFKKEKIESISVSASEGNVHTVHLVSDNDKGISKLFKIRLTIK